MPEVDLAVTESSEKEAKGKKPAAKEVAKSAKKVVTPVKKLLLSNLPMLIRLRVNCDQGHEVVKSSVQEAKKRCPDQGHEVIKSSVQEVRKCSGEVWLRTGRDAGNCAEDEPEDTRKKVEKHPE